MNTGKTIDFFRNLPGRHCEEPKATWQSRIPWIASALKRFAMTKMWGFERSLILDTPTMKTSLFIPAFLAFIILNPSHSYSNVKNDEAILAIEEKSSENNSIESLKQKEWSTIVLETIPGLLTASVLNAIVFIPLTVPGFELQTALFSCPLIGFSFILHLIITHRNTYMDCPEPNCLVRNRHFLKMIAGYTLLSISGFYLGQTVAF